MLQPQLSIIVAVYNVAEYLPKCIESILQQTFQDFELILVDDGATDDSAVICEKYRNKDSRIQLLHKINGGQASARNEGLKIAKGRYIGFVDGDDWIEPDMYETLMTIAESENVDIVQCGWYKVYNGIKESCANESLQEVYSNKEALTCLVYDLGAITTSVCTKIFLQKIISTLSFLEVRAYEDDEFIYKSVAASNRIICLGAPKYNYLTRENSTMTAKFNLNKLALVAIQRKICDVIQTNIPELFPKAQRSLCSKQFYLIACLLHHAELDPDTQLVRNIRTEILKDYTSFMGNPLMGMNKILLWLLKYMPGIAYCLIKLKFR